MKKTITLLALCATVIFANAQVFTENFESHAVGSNLEGTNGWYVCLKSGDNLGVSPTIAAGTLTYTGYASSGVGKVAVLDSINGSVSTSQRISTKIVQLNGEDLTAVVGEKIYVAFLAKISVDSKKGAARDFVNIEGSATSSMTRGRVFAKVTNEGELSFGISKNGTTFTEANQADGLSVNDTHLLVMVYETIEGESNDKLTLYYNPDLTKTEAEQTNKVAANDTQTDYAGTAKLGVNLRQRGIGAQIGGIRVAKSWAGAVGAGSASNPEVKANFNNIRLAGKSIVTDCAGTLSVFNLTGTEILSQPTNGNFETNLTNGMYIVRFVNAQGIKSTAKIVVK